MKKRILFCLALALLLSGCGKETRTITCDGCGAEIAVDADSNITDEWIVFCKTCEEEKFGGTGVVEGSK